jgi:hypothetical protein
MRGRKDSALAQVDIFGRLLLALLMAAESGKQLWANWDSLSSTKTITSYGIWKALLDELREVVLETKNWSILQWCRKLKMLVQRQRNRKLQRIEKKVLNNF